VVEILDADVLIIGGGVAGTVAAIKARSTGAGVLLVDKSTVGWAGQAAMSGGFVWVIAPEDDLEAWARWQIAKGDFLNDQDWVYAMAERSWPAVQEVASWGAPFLKDERGAVRLARYPSFPQSYRGARFDAGRFLRPLRDKAVTDGVRVIDKVEVVELLQDGDRVAGALGFGIQDARPYIFRAASTVLANGSCDFKVERLFSTSCGEGVAMAYQAGAEMRNAEFGNLYGPRMKELDTFFRGSLVRYATNALGERICDKYLSSEESAELGLMVQGMVREVEAGRGPIRLDFADLPPDFDDALKPAATDPSNPERLLAKLGLATTLSSAVELVPAFMGKLGPVKVDLNFATTVPGLWAVGDTSHLGSTWEGAAPPGEVPGLCIAYALISGLAGGLAAAQAVEAAAGPQLEPEAARARWAELAAPLGRTNGVAPADLLYQLQALVYPIQSSLFRRGERLQAALDRLADLWADMDRLQAADGHELVRCHEVASIALCAEMMLRSALARTESRGSHLREDYPERDDQDWLRWTVLRKDGERMAVATEAIPISRYGHRPEPRRTPRAAARSKASLQPPPDIEIGGARHGTGSAGHAGMVEELDREIAGLALLDMKDRQVSLADNAGQVVIVAGGGRVATEDSKRWGEALEREYGGTRNVRLFRLAIIENLPRFVPRSLVKGQLGKDSAAAPMLVDWGGSANSLIDPAHPEMPHVWVLDKRCRLRFRLATEPSDEGLQALREQVNFLRQEG
jgi:succinate dehydrogenase / fumarate reductase flavoprotein subunit